MLTTDFYKILHDEVLATAEKNKTLPLLKNEKDERARKSKAFMLWFLSFYSQQPIFQEHITDGDGDGSCDMIFSNRDSTGENVFYIVQAKWINMEFGADGKLTKRPEQYTKIDKEEFNAVLTDFAAVLNGSRQPTKNAVFNAKYQELKVHLKENGRAKFIFFTAADDNDSIKESIISFNHDQAPNVTLELMDINRIKTDFINTRYKQIVKINPLEDFHSAEESEITLDIVRFDESSTANREILQFKGSSAAYVVLLRPKTIHNLFKTYKFGLFYKNVRNPLLESNYNEAITNTILKRPSAFWYFNNGITAITKLMPEIGKTAESFKIQGLQIINGAQTVYSVYAAYEKATAIQRNVMDADACIMLRLIRSSDEQFNHEITRYTNQQNQILPRDFVANDDVQERLQKESFKTNYWYERRRGEFREMQNEQIGIVSNEIFANAYFIFHLQKPIEAINNEEKFFLKQEDNGFYEQIFNAETTFEDMLAAFLVQDVFDEIVDEKIAYEKLEDYSQGLAADLYDYISPYVALSKIVLQNYLQTKYKGQKPVNLSKYIIDLDSKQPEKFNALINNIFDFTQKYASAKYLAKDKSYEEHQFLLYLRTNPSNYDLLAKELAEVEINIADIEREQREG